MLRHAILLHLVTLHDLEKQKFQILIHNLKK